MDDYKALAIVLRNCVESANGLNIQAADAIDALIAALTASNEVIAKSKPKWISVNERMPDVNQPVLICIFGKYVGEGKYCGHNDFHAVWKDHGPGTYWDNEVTHWMPLPEPPNEVEE